MKLTKIGSGKKKAALPTLETKPTSDDILSAILPPREWVENGIHYTQYVSHKPAERDDILSLTKELDKKLTERQARDNGICPVREELFSQCFDEIIRQVTINCPERGLLLHRVRDEIRMTIAAYQTLYQSAVVFGIRKQIQAQHGMGDIAKKLEDLRKKKARLENREIELKSKQDALDKKNKEKAKVDEERRTAELDFLKYQENHLSQFLNTLQEGAAAK